MKSKTLSSNLTIFKKDITRFSPVWLIWCIAYLITGYLFYSNEYDITQKFSIFPSLAPIANMVYGLGCAILLFGYLFDPKECITTHSLPIRREHLFLTHLLAGFAMHIVPSTLFTLAIAPLCEGNVFATLGLMILQFTFFYGLGIFCVMLTGRKFAAAAMFGLINFASILTYFAANIVYIPMLPGIELSADPFVRFCPPAAMMFKNTYRLESWTFGPDLMAYCKVVAIFAAVGIGLILVSLVLYRIRKLECAENFMAFSKLNVLFVFVCTVFCGCFFTIFSTLFVYQSYWIMLGLGVVIGYFASMMLLKRSPKVFHAKSFAGLAVIAVLVAGSVFAVKMDPFGFVSYVPSTNEVARVELHGYRHNNSFYFTEDPAQMEKLMQLHEDLINQLSIEQLDEYQPTEHVELIYHMTNGKTVKRIYDARDALMEQVSWYKSQPEYQLGVSTVEELLEKTTAVELNIYHPKTDDNEESYSLDKKDQESLLKIVFDECKAGKLDQTSVYSYFDTTEPQESVYSLYFTVKNGNPDLSGNYMTNYLEIPQTATNTIAWLAQYASSHR